MRVSGLILTSVLVGVMLAGCGDADRLDQLEQDLAEAQAEVEALKDVSPSAATTVSIASTTTTAMTTTTTLLTKLEPAELVWCDGHPWQVIHAALVLGYVDQPRVDGFEAGGITAFWLEDGWNLFTGQKFDTLPNDWYEYPGAIGFLNDSLDRWMMRGAWKRNESCRAAFQGR